MSDSSSELLKNIKKMNQQNEKLTEQNTKLVEALVKAKSSRTGGGGGGKGSGGGGDSGGSVNSNGGSVNSGNGNSRRQPPKCGICGKMHKTENCFELEKNKEKRSDNWKSVFE